MSFEVIPLRLFEPPHFAMSSPFASTCTKVCFVVTPYFFLRSVELSKSTLSIERSVFEKSSFWKFFSAVLQLGHHEAWKKSTVSAFFPTRLGL